MAGTAGKEATLSWAATGVDDIRDFTPPGGSRNLADITTRDSTDDAMERIAVQRDDTPATFTLLFDDAVVIQATLQAAFMSGSIAEAIAVVAGVTYTWNGIVTKFDVSAPYEDAVTAEVEIAVANSLVLT